MTADNVTVSLVNTSPIRDHTLVVQGGAYGEHQFASAALDGQAVAIENNTFEVRLSPGCGGRLVCKMKRYANQPTFAFPWDRG
jgi:hypothetical protein